MPPARATTPSGPAIVASLLVLLLLGLATGAHAGATDAPARDVEVADVIPRSGEVVDPGEVAITVVTTAGTGAGHAIDVVVGGQPVATEATADPDGIRHTGRVTLPPGDHIGRVDVDGALRYLWRFTVDANPLRRRTDPSTIALAAADAVTSWPAGDASGAVLVRADGVVDALAGVALAARVGGPLLLTDGDRLSAAAATAIAEAVRPGSTVHLLGGVDALRDEVADDIRTLGFTPQRLAGPDRYATAALAAPVGRAAPGHGDHPARTAYLVSGVHTADALAASVVAALDLAPILLTSAEDLPAPTLDALIAAAPDEIRVLGGTAVIGEAVLEQLRGAGFTVTRTAGPDRFATAAAVALGHTFPSGGVTITTSTDPLAALVAAGVAAHAGQPLLLADSDRLTASSRQALSTLPPGQVTLHGDVVDQVGRTARALLVDARRGAVLALAPDPGSALDVGAGPEVGGIGAVLDLPVIPDQSTVTALVDDRVVGARLVPGEDAATVGIALDVPSATTPTTVRVVAQLAVAEEVYVHLDWAFDLPAHDRRFATVAGIDLLEPSATVEVIGFHQSGNDGARDLVPAGNGTPTSVMPSRGRGTGPRTAADIVAHPDRPITAPATGTVVRAGTYLLYCDTPDHVLVIDPDQHPGWEVKLLHFEGLSVEVGDRVVAGETVVGSRPRPLPFHSQVDELSGPEDWPHVHVEVVDPTIPDRPGGTC